MTSIILYGTPWCGDCKRSRMFLDQNDVNYEYVDISENQEAAEKVEKINGGLRSVPTILFPDGTVLTEPPNHELQTALERNGFLGAV